MSTKVPASESVADVSFSTDVLNSTFGTEDLSISKLNGTKSSIKKKRVVKKGARKLSVTRSTAASLARSTLKRSTAKASESPAKGSLPKSPAAVKNRGSALVPAAQKRPTNSSAAAKPSKAGASQVAVRIPTALATAARVSADRLVQGPGGQLKTPKKARVTVRPSLSTTRGGQRSTLEGSAAASKSSSSNSSSRVKDLETLCSQQAHEIKRLQRQLRLLPAPSPNSSSKAKELEAELKEKDATIARMKVTLRKLVGDRGRLVEKLKAITEERDALEKLLGGVSDQLSHIKLNQRSKLR
jgi:hypothetical protein